MYPIEPNLDLTFSIFPHHLIAPNKSEKITESALSPLLRSNQNFLDHLEAIHYLTFMDSEED